MILQRNYDFFILGSMIVFTYALYYKNLQSCRVHEPKIKTILLSQITLKHNGFL